MIIDAEHHFVTLNLGKAAEVVCLSIEEAEKCIEGIKLFADYVKNILPEKKLGQVWEIQVGLFEDGIALKFNQRAKKVSLPYKVALEVARRMQAVVDSYKCGYSIQLKCKK